MQEISPLPDAGSELAIAPAEPLAAARPAARWPIALVVSGLLHAAMALPPAKSYSTETTGGLQMAGNGVASIGECMR